MLSKMNLLIKKTSLFAFNEMKIRTQKPFTAVNKGITSETNSEK